MLKCRTAEPDMGLWQAILDTIRHATFVDVIDVALIAYIFYRAALALRGTRAVSLARGILIIALLFALNTRLPTFSWILRHVLPTGLIALVVIFQPELRMALERLGRGGIFRFNLEGSNLDNLKRDISEVMDACEEFSSRRIGALIAFERQASLNEIIRTGKTLDGVISAELLETIFAPRSPLHDGAVVIRQGRITAAGCVLPHSENPGLAVSTGMRHRAALGLTERTDAVCVIVSEETGGMALTISGSITPSMERMQITERLLELFEARADSSRFFFWRK